MAGFAAGPPPAVAPDGFDVARHGLSFANFASTRGLTVADAVMMFGDEAVCGPGDGTCIVDPQALSWIETVSASMAGGVCEGMVLFSLDRFVARVEPLAATLELDDPVQSRIAQLFATQFLPGVGDATLRGADAGLDAIVERIEAGLAAGGDPVTVGVYDEGGGHALLPVSVQHLDARRVVVGVYDVNWPGAARVLEIDREAGAWRYSIDSSDQATDQAAWVGDASSIDVTPLSARADLGSGPFDVEGGRSVLTATFHGRGWSVDNGAERIDATGLAIGDGGVVGIARGAFGTTTVVIEAAGSVKVSAPGAAHLALQTDAGWFTAATSTGADVSVDADARRLAVDAGAADVTVATSRGLVRFSGRTGSSVTIEPATVVVSDPAWGSVVAEQPDGARTDWQVSADGRLAAETPLELPSSVRRGADPGSVDGSVTGSTTSTSVPSGAPVDAVGGTSTTAALPPGASSTMPPSSTIAASPSTTATTPAPSTSVVTSTPPPSTSVTPPSSTAGPPTTSSSGPGTSVLPLP